MQQKTISSQDYNAAAEKYSALKVQAARTQLLFNEMAAALKQTYLPGSFGGSTIDWQLIAILSPVVGPLAQAQHEARTAFDQWLASRPEVSDTIPGAITITF